MDQQVDIEDVVIPLRTYAWAVTGSVRLADALLEESFETIVSDTFAALPATRLEWFNCLDDVIVNWSIREQDISLTQHSRAIQTIKMATSNQPEILGKLLDR